MRNFIDQNNNSADAVIEVTAPAGRIIGRSDGYVRRFLGIPYAAAERWQRPRPLPRGAVIEALAYGPAPWQDDGPGCAIMPAWRSAQCLNLNLYTSSAETEEKRPVMVWIYGGAQIAGSNVGMHAPGPGLPELSYDGRFFVREHPEIVLVVPNYRVGLWGSLDLSCLEGTNDAYRESANSARLDILQCLRWLRENVAAFGGDPDNITLFGQSAGSSNITALMLMPEAQGLFQKVICESSFAMDISLTSRNDSRRISEALFSLLCCKTLDEALAKTDEELLRAQQSLAAASMGGSSAFSDIESKLFSPVVDGVTIPEDYWRRFLLGGSRAVRFLGGTNIGEYDQQFLPMNGDADAARRFTIAQNWGKLDPERGTAPEETARFLSRYTEIRSAFEACEDLKADLYLRMGAIAWALVCSQFGSAYLYHLALPRPDGRRFGHGEEIPMLFGTDSETPLIQQRALRDAWCTFARIGDPNCPALRTRWLPFTAQHWETLLLDEKPRLVHGVRPEDCRALLPLFRETREYPDFSALCAQYEG